MKYYPIHETFHSWQGEGVHMGRNAVFIRTYGCPVQCPWCDSAGTWHPDFKPDQVRKETPNVLADWAASKRPDFVVITGGEPTIHDLTPLCDALHARGLPVHLETAGAYPIRGKIDWVTVSPKRAKLPLPENNLRAQEWKLIIESEADIDYWLSIIPELRGQAPVWLHPEWSKAQDIGVLNSITKTVKAYGYPFRAGYQLHKLYQADELG